jgi:hypothetical protein
MRFIDVVAVNTAPIPAPLQHQYAQKRALPVENDLNRLQELGIKVIAKPLAAVGPKIRHDPALIADIAIHLAGEGRRKRIRMAKRVSK